jgi:trigger factor
MSTEEQEREAGTTVAVGDEPGAVETDAGSKRKLEMQVDISEAGPCKKHVKVSIPRSEIERQFTASLNEFGKDVAVPGFRPGRAPRQLVIKRFKKQVADQVKSSLLMASLEQLDADYELDPITQPQLDVAAIELPEDGPMNFEIDVEVRPEFELPEYHGLSLKRPVRPITDADIETYLRQHLERHGQVVPKLEGAAELGDFITADLVFFRPDGSVLNEVKEIQFRLQPELRFRDGAIPRLGESLVGARPGETRRAEAKLGSATGEPALRGATVRVDIRLHDLKQMRLPETNTAFLNSIGFESLDELREAVKEALGRRIQGQQRQALRRQILDQLLDRTPFELPADLVAREEASTIRRLVMQLRQEGITDNEIRASEAAIRANAREAALRSLKELILLAKVAEAEKIEVDDEDFEVEVESMAERSGESPRRIRSRLEKEGMTDQITTQILERKVIDFILQASTVEDDATAVAEPEEAVETLDHSASAEVETPSPEEEAEAAGGPRAEAAEGSGPEAEAAPPAES